MKILDQLKTELFESLNNYERYLETIPEIEDDRSEEQKAKIAEYRAKHDELDAKIDSLEKRESAEKRHAELRAKYAAPEPGPTGKDFRDDPSGHSIEVRDRPVYTGPWALGLQLRDLADSQSMDHRKASRERRQAASRRLERCENRRIHIEDEENRAAGSPTYQTDHYDDGGIFMQTEQAMDLIDKGFNNSEVISRSQRRTMTGPTDSIEIIGRKEDSRKDGSRHGGVTWYPMTETGDYTATKMLWEMINLKVEKIGAAYYASEKMLNDVGMLTGEVDQIVQDEFAFDTQRYAVEGNGAPVPFIGLVNSPCKITVPKKSGQLAGTFVWENYQKMKSRLPVGSRKSAVWFYNVNLEDQLENLFYPLGDGGELARAFKPSPDGIKPGRLGMFPAVPIEQCEVPGTEGDIILTDMSQYITVTKGGMRSASSIHVKFLNDQMTFKFSALIGGMSRWKSALTPYKGTITTSPIITLAVRA